MHSMIRTNLIIVVGILSLLPTCCFAKDNTPPKGFVALFNGKNLNGWQGLVANPPKRAAMSPDELRGKRLRDAQYSGFHSRTCW